MFSCCSVWRAVSMWSGLDAVCWCTSISENPPTEMTGDWCIQPNFPWFVPVLNWCGGGGRWWGGVFENWKLRIVATYAFFWSWLIIFVHFCWGSKVLSCWTWPGAFLVWQVPLQQRPLAFGKKISTSLQPYQPQAKSQSEMVSFRSWVHLILVSDLGRPKTATFQGSADHNVHILEIL